MEEGSGPRPEEVLEAAKIVERVAHRMIERDVSNTGKIGEIDSLITATQNRQNAEKNLAQRDEH
jgi:hypothetical protein